MKKLGAYDELFLVKNAHHYPVETTLPFRLQKRGMLSHLGFPRDKQTILCLAQQQKLVLENYSNFQEEFGYPFLILVFEMVMHTAIPKLFIVNAADSILWRDDSGTVQEVSYTECVSIIAGFADGTWIEFAQNMWTPDVVAGRLLYLDRATQEIELQQGVRPAELVNRRDIPTYYGHVESFWMESYEYRSQVRALRAAGYNTQLSWGVVKSVLGELSAHAAAFRQLREIARMPTLEFAFLPSSRKLVCVDIDWPGQWLHEEVNQ